MGGEGESEKFYRIHNTTLPERVAGVRREVCSRGRPTKSARSRLLDAPDGEKFTASESETVSDGTENCEDGTVSTVFSAV